MKNRKGFTIVELVIVIAVIAILAAVLIPTFAGIISKANQSSAQQEAASAMKVALAMSTDATLPSQTAFVIYNKTAISYCYEYVNNKLTEASADEAKNMTVTGYNTVIDSIIASVDFFLGNNEETLNPVQIWTAATAKVKDLCNKLNAFDNATYAGLNYSEEAKVWYKFVKEGTGYTLSLKVADAAPADEDEADKTVTVYTSVDIKSDILVFVPKHTAA